MPPRCIPFPVALIDANEGRGIGLQQDRGRAVTTGLENTVGDTVIEGEHDGVRVRSTITMNNIK